MQPGQVVLIQPFRCREIKNVPYHAQGEVDALGLDPLLAPCLDKGLQCPDVDRFDRQVADVRVQLFQVQRGIGDAAFMLVLIQVLGCGPPKYALRPYAIDDRLPDFLRFLCEVFFRLCEAVFSSAIANADTSGR